MWMLNISMYKWTGRLAGVGLKAYARRSKPLGDPVGAQAKQLLSLVDRARSTKFGIDHDFGSIRSVADFQQRVPIRSYEGFWNDYWSAPFPELDDVTWPGRIRYFARSSGTTTGQSKHIPCSDEMIKANNTAGLRVVLHHLRNHPRSTVAEGRTFLFGSANLDELAPEVFAGELSGIAARETPSWAGKGRYYPPPELAALTDWNDKLDQMASDCVGNDIRAISGVPTWLLILFDRAFEHAKVEDRRLIRLFPELELVTHGGINFAPYLESFKRLLDGSGADLREVYAASEGFIAIADRSYGDGMQMLLDNGLFFEFIEIDELAEPHPKRRWLADVETGVNYALILTSCAGLWSYSIGDIVRFVHLDPHRIVVAGRVSQTLSAFGEHLTGEELEIAVTEAATHLGVSVRDFAVAPVFRSDGGGAIGGHRYVIESAETSAVDMAAAIDAALAEQNSDYQAKRVDNIAIALPTVAIVAPGTFAAWMHSKGKSGGQHKAPRVTTLEQLDTIEGYQR